MLYYDNISDLPKDYKIHSNHTCIVHRGQAYVPSNNCWDLDIAAFDTVALLYNNILFADHQNDNQYG
jgi:hypothetical protein